MRVIEAIDMLCDTPAAGSGLKGEFEGLRRLRVGNFRVVDEWQHTELVILVVGIGHPGRKAKPVAAPSGLQVVRLLPVP